MYGYIIPFLASSYSFLILLISLYFLWCRHCCLESPLMPFTLNPLQSPVSCIVVQHIDLKILYGRPWETTRSTFEQVPIELVFVELYTISHLFSKYRVIYHHHHRTATTAWHEWLTHSRERRNNDKTFLLLLLFCNTEWSDEGGDSSSSIFYICFYYYFLLFFFTLRRIACIRDLSALLRARRQ